MEVSIDTKSLKENGQDIMRLSNELNEILNDMFERLTSINTKTFEWYGDGANEYVRRLNIEKTEFMNFKDEIFEYGKYLDKTADVFEEKINSNRCDK